MCVSSRRGSGATDGAAHVSVRGSRASRATSRSVGALGLSLGLSLGSGCLVDQGRCGSHQEHNAVGNCVCISGYVLANDLQCRPCGEHQRSVGDRCLCQAGYAFDAQQNCVPQAPPSSVEACQRSEDCPANVPTCHMPNKGDPYCSVTGCKSAADCPGGFGCDTDAVPAVCVRPPTGQATPCTSSADCAGKEASYCETYSAHVCLVPGCKVAGDCFPGWDCCDLSSYSLGSLCVPEGTCLLP